MENTNLEEKKSNKVIFGLKIAGNVIFYAVIILLLIFSIMNIKAGSSNGGFPNIFGKGFLAVKTESMERDTGSGSGVPSYYDDYSIGEIKKNDLVYEKVLNSKSINNLKVGDVITFFDPSIKALNTHRIVIIDKTDGVVTRIVCQGDYSVSLFGVYDPVNGTPSTNQSLIDRGDIQIISDMSNVKGIVTGVKSGAGKVILNIQQNWLWYFVLPVLVFLLIEIFMVIKNIMDLKGAKQKAELASNKEVMMADLEAQKEEMRKQILAELKAQQAALDDDKKEEKVDDVSDSDDEEARLESPAVSVVEVEKPSESKDDILNNEMIEESAVLEEVEPVVENKEPKVETPKKSTTKSTTAKKTTTSKKSSSSTKSGTPKKSTTTKKSSTGTKKAKSTDSSVENKEE